MDVEIAINRRARLGKYDVMLFTADGGCQMLDEKFDVLAEIVSPVATVAITQAPPPEECPEETGDQTPSDAHEMPHGGTDTAQQPQTGTETYVAASYPETVKAVLKTAGVANITDYRKYTSDQPFELQKGRERKIEFDVEEGETIDSAWLVSSNAPHKVVKCTEMKQDRNHVIMLFDSTVPARGPHDLVKIMSDKSAVHVEQAVILK